MIAVYLFLGYQGLSLVKDCYLMKLESLTNATVVDDAMKFVSDRSKENLKSSSNNSNTNEDDKESHEPDYDKDKEQLEEEQEEEKSIGRSHTHE